MYIKYSCTVIFNKRNNDKSYGNEIYVNICRVSNITTTNIDRQIRRLLRLLAKIGESVKLTIRLHCNMYGTVIRLNFVNAPMIIRLKE